MAVGTAEILITLIFLGVLGVQSQFWVQPSSLYHFVVKYYSFSNFSDKFEIVNIFENGFIFGVVFNFEMRKGLGRENLGR